jgi:hypothetical protein
MQPAAGRRQSLFRRFLQRNLCVCATISKHKNRKIALSRSELCLGDRNLFII